MLSAPSNAEQVQDCMQHLSTRNRDKSISCVTNLINQSPKNTYNYILRATIYSSFNEASKAIEDLTYVIGIDGKNCQAFSLRGIIYSHQNRYNEAIADISNGIRVCSAAGSKTLMGSLYSQRANLHSQVRAFQKSTNDYEQAAKIMDSISQAQWAIIHGKNSIATRGNLFSEIYQGICSNYIKVQNFTESLQACKKSLEYQPNNTMAQINLASSYIELNRHSDAINLLESITDKSQLFLVNYNLSMANLKLYKQSKDDMYKTQFELYKQKASAVAKSPENIAIIEKNLRT